MESEEGGGAGDGGSGGVVCFLLFLSVLDMFSAVVVIG